MLLLEKSDLALPKPALGLLAVLAVLAVLAIFAPDGAELPVPRAAVPAAAE